MPAANVLLLLAALTLLPAVAAAEDASDAGPLAGWPHCPPYAYTLVPPAYELDPDCLFPLPLIHPELP